MALIKPATSRNLVPHSAPSGANVSRERLRESREQARNLGPHAEFMAWRSATPGQLAARSARAEGKAKTSRRLRTSLKACSGPKEVLKLALSFESRGVTAEDRTIVLETLRDQKAWPELARYYEASIAADPSFRQHTVSKEHYLLSLNKGGKRAQAILLAKDMCKSLAPGPGAPVRSQDIDLERVHRARGVNGEVLGGLGSAFRLVSDEAARGPLGAPVARALAEELGVERLPSALDASRAALEVSTRYYEAGFAVDCEYYPGINAIYNNLLLGRSERAEQLAPIVSLACEQAGGVRAQDYWCTTTMLELAVLTRQPDEVRSLLPEVLKQAKVGWELGSTAKSLERLTADMEQRGASAEVPKYLASALRALEKASDEAQAKTAPGEKAEPVLPPKAGRIEEIEAGMAAALQRDGWAAPVAKTKLEDVKDSDLFRALESKGTYFRGMSSHFVGGNVPYGGLVPDLAVGRADCDLARQVLTALGLDRSASFDQFDARIDRYLAQRFALGTKDVQRPLEDLHSPEHVLMDTFRKSLLEFTKTEATGSCTTSVMAEVALGRGDCRHVAYAKQLFYDVWKKEQETRLGREAIAASLSGDTPSYERAMNEIRALASEQLLTFTSLIKAPIEMHSMYHMKTDASGAPIRLPGVSNDRTEHFSEVENHTYNARVRRDQSGQVHLELRDAFYQQLYDFSNRSVDPEAFLSGKGCQAGFMNPPGDYRGEPIPVQLILTKYSAGKIERVKGEYGGMRVGGQPVEPPSIELLLSKDTRPEVVEQLSQPR